MIDFSKESDFPVDISLDFFFHILYRTQRSYINFLLKDSDLNFSEFIVLLKLLDKEDISQVEICKSLKEDRGSLARILNKLEEKEYILRKQDVENRRCNKIFLTKKGKNFALEFKYKMGQREKELIEEIPMDLIEFKKILKNMSIKSIKLNKELMGD